MADELIYIPNDDTHNYPFCRLKFKRLNTQPNELTDQKLLS